MQNSAQESETAMSNIDYDILKQQILSSNNFEECPKPPMIRLRDDDNYVFISYSHKDYKAVFCDLLEFHKAGVRFWYDSGLPAGKEWNKVVESKIGSEKCSGVIFFLSSSMFLSRSVLREVELATSAEGSSGGKCAKNYFCINLEGVQPSNILFNIIQSRSVDELRSLGLDTYQIAKLASSFKDEVTYIIKQSAESNSHIASTVEQLDLQFNVIEGSETDTQGAKKSSVSGNLSVGSGRLIKYLGKDKELTLPQDITRIESRAFGDCRDLRSVTLPEGIKYIGEFAFENCSSLSEINYNGSIKDFDAIEKDWTWDIGTAEYTVRCKDGIYKE